MRVLYISHTANAHGSGASLSTLAVGLRERGHRIMVVVPEAGALSHQLLHRDIEVAQSKCFWWAVARQTPLKARQWYLRQIARAAREIAGVIREFRPDVVHTNNAVIPSGALAATFARVPHVWHLREHIEPRFGLQFILGEPASKWLMGILSAALIAVSRSVAAAYTCSTTQPKMHLVYDGLEIRPELVNAVCSLGVSEPPVLALMGNLLPLKGQEDAIRAVAILRDRGTVSRLVLIGADPVGYGERLRTIAKELKVSHSIAFTGHLADPLPEAAKANIVLMCSLCEGFGRVTVEAMLLGKPVVGADTCGTLEIMEDQRTGLLYRQGDPYDLAEKIASLLGNPRWAAELGRTGREVALAKFSIGRYVGRVMGIYRQVAAPEASMPHISA